jgi:3-oxoacyl-[acyl-carrier protein] reductase
MNGKDQRILMEASSPDTLEPEGRIHQMTDTHTFLTGKTAIVTGGSRGIGYAIAEALLKAGASVVICGTRQESVDTAVRSLTVSAKGGNSTVAGTTANVAKPAEVLKLFRFATDLKVGIDIVVNNAGIGVFKKTADLTIEEWQAVIDTNLSGAFYCAKQAIECFRKRGGGHLINISSLAGKNAFATGAAYNASKFGLNGFSEALMQDHRAEGIKVSYVMPGSVNTDFGRAGKADWKIAPEDVAEIVLMLLRMPKRTLVSRVEVRPSIPA